MNKSLINITDQFRQLAQNHNMINDFGSGNTADIGQSREENRQLDYPYMWIDYSDTNYAIGQNRGISAKLYTMSLTILDKYSPNVKNVEDVMSDVEEYISDIIQYYLNSPTMKEFRLDTNSITARPVEDEDKDGAIGWNALITFRIPYAFCASNLPIGTPPSGGGAAPSTYSINDSDGNVLYSGSISAGSSLVQVIGDTEVQNSSSTYNVTVNAEGTLILPDITVTDSDGSTLTVPAMTDVVCTPNPPALDANVSNSDDSYTTTVASGGNLELPDVTITAKDSANATIHTEVAPSVQDVEIVITDSGVTNSDGSYTASVKAEGSLTLPDVLVSAENSSGAVLASQGIPSAQDHTLSIADIDVSVNTTVEGQVPVGDIDINIEDTAAATVTPNSVTITGNAVDIVVPEALPLASTFPTTSGATTVVITGDDADLGHGRGVDFFTLSNNNPFGNTLRFTGTTGTSTIQSDGIMLDWNHQDGTAVHAWYATDQASAGVVNDMTTLSSATYGGYTGWVMPNIKEVITLMNYSLANKLDWAPLNLTPIIVKSGTISPTDSTKGYVISPSTGNVTSETLAFGNPRKFIPFRYMTYTELGL